MGASPSHPCGTPCKDGTLCERTVTDGAQCWQHRGEVAVDLLWVRTGLSCGDAMRHLNRVWDGLLQRDDPPLTDRALAEAKQAVARLRDGFKDPWAVMAPPVLRALETAHALYPRHRLRAVPHLGSGRVPPGGPAAQLAALLRLDPGCQVDLAAVVTGTGAWAARAHQAQHAHFLRWLARQALPRQSRARVHVVVVVPHGVLQQVFPDDTGVPHLAMAVQHYAWARGQLRPRSANPAVRYWSTGSAEALHFDGLARPLPLTPADVARCGDTDALFRHAPVARAPWPRDPAAAVWMRHLPDRMLLRDVVLPQTHDAATGHMLRTDRSTWSLSRIRSVPQWLTRDLNRWPVIFDWACTQAGSLADQVWSGVRSLDLRVHLPRHGPALFHHGHVLIHTRVLHAVQDLATFLRAHPSETLLLHFAFADAEGPVGKFWGRLLDTLQRLGVPVYTGPTPPDHAPLRDLRGHVVLFAHAALTGLEALGAWPPVESWYKAPQQAGSCAPPWTRLCQSWDDLTRYYLPCFPTPETHGKLCTLQLHAQVDTGLVLGGGSIAEVAAQVNPHVEAWLRDRQGHRANVVEVDYWHPSMLGAFLDANGVPT